MKKTGVCSDRSIVTFGHIGVRSMFLVSGLERNSLLQVGFKFSFDQPLSEENKNGPWDALSEDTFDLDCSVNVT